MWNIARKPALSRCATESGLIILPRPPPDTKTNGCYRSGFRPVTKTRVHTDGIGIREGLLRPVTSTEQCRRLRITRDREPPRVRKLGLGSQTGYARELTPSSPSLNQSHIPDTLVPAVTIPLPKSDKGSKRPVTTSFAERRRRS